MPFDRQPTVGFVLQNTAIHSIVVAEGDLEGATHDGFDRERAAQPNSYTLRRRYGAPNPLDRSAEMTDEAQGIRSDSFTKFDIADSGDGIKLFA